METETQTTSNEVEAVEQIVKTGNGNSDLLQEREKIRQLEIELERMEKVLQCSETHNRQLKMELSLAEQKLEERGEICKEFELNKKNLQEEIREAEKKYICRIDVLQQELNEQELKNKELATVKETFDRTSVELEKSTKKVQDLERELQCSLSEARMFENLSNENRLHAEKEEQKTKNLEKSIELLKMNANKTESEIEILKEELEKSKSLVHEMEKKLHLYQASEEQTKKDITEMEGLLSLTKQELQFKVNMIEETQLKLTEEEKRKEMEVSRLQKEYDMLSQEKKALETSLAETNNNLFQVKDKCADLTEKLSLSEDKFNKTDSLLSQALSNSCNLEIKLKSLEEQQKEFAEVVERNAKLQNMVEELNTSVRDTGLLLKEAEDIFVSSELKNEELERMLNMAESNVVETEKKLKREGLEFHNRISQMELNLNQKDSRNSELELELKKLKEGIHVITENKTELEGALNSSNAKLVTSETLLNDLTHQLRETKENLEKTCLDLETSRINEKKTTEKLRILDIQLEEQKTQVQQASARYSDLELKLHDELEKFMQKENDLQNQLEEARKKLEKVYLDLEASGINEKETMKKLGILDMQLQEQKAQVQRASARNSELELKLKDELDKFIKKENDLQNQLEKGKERLEKAYLDLEASRINEKETTKKLGILHIQLEEQRNQFQQASARNSELELKLKDELDKFMQKENDLQNQLGEAKEKLEKTCLDLETSRGNENETMKKREILDIQLEEQRTQLQQASARHSELELKLKDELDKFMQKENDLQNQLGEAKEKLDKTYLDLETSRGSHNETMKKREILDIQLEEQRTQLQKVSASHSELELKLKDELDKFMQKENDLQNRLGEAKEKLEKTCLDFELSRINENETMKKLGILDIKLEEQRAQLQEASTRNSELELKLKNEQDKFMQKENDLQNQLGEAKEKLEKTCLDLEASGINEKEIMKKLGILDTQLQEQRTQLQQATARNSELELKLKDELDKFMQRENDLQNQLGETKGKLEKTCLDLETSRGSHNETMKKREILDIQLEEQRTQLQKVSASHSELELKLKDELDKFMQKENDLQNRLGEAKEKLDKTCLDFEALRINENETVKKLGILDIQLEEQRTQLQEASARNSELELKLKNELNKFMQKENDLQNQLGEAKEKLEKTCIDLEASGINEKEIMKKLGILDTQLQEQRAQLQQATARNSELELKLKDELDKFMQRENDLQNQLGETKGKLEKTCLDLETSRGSHNETMKKREILEIQLEEASSRHSELELKHKDARDKFIQQAEETKVLHDKIFSLENQANVESGKFSSLKEALEERAKKLAELEYINDKLVKDLSEANARAEGSNLECELLTATNTKIMEEISVHELKNKELEGLLISVEREKKDISEQIIELSNEKSRVFETQQHELEESCLKLKNLEIILEEKKLKIDHLEQENRDLSKSNSNLTQKHLTEENKINELSTVLNKMIMEKNNLQERLHSSEVLVKNMEESEKKAIEEKESNVREIEEKLFLAQKENNDLKQELHLAQIKFSETDKERKSFYDKASELSILFKNLEAESKNKISKLESDLNNSYSKNAELEAELKLDAERCIELKSKVGLAEQHMIELEDVLKVSNKNIIELNEQLNTTAVERKAIESSSNISREKLLESQNLIHKLSNELTSTQEKLEVAEKELESFADRETKIKERLKFSEELIDNSGKMREEATKRSLEPEILCESQATISETKLKDANTQFFEKDAENKDLLQKLMALEDQLKIFLEKDTEESQRSLTLNAELDESLRKIKTLEKRIDELQVNLSEEEDKSKLVRENNLLLDMKIKEVQDLLTSTQMEKQATESRLQILEKQAKNYETRSEELDLKLKSVEIHQESGHKLEECENKIAKLDNDMSRSRGLATVESTINALKSQLAEDDDTVRRYSSEKDRLSDENLLQQELNTHRAKINELEEILSRVQNGEVLNPDFTIEPSTQKSSMASHEMTYQNLESKAIALQIKVRQLEEDKIKLDESNLKLSRELEENQANMDQLYSNLNSTLVDKETNGQFPISKVTVETLMHHVASEKEQLKSQISSVGEENIQLRKQLEDIKAELKIATSKKDEKLNEDEEKEDSPDKIPTSTSLSEVVELEQKLLLDESRLKIETQSSKPTIDEEEVKRENTSKRNRHIRTNSLRSSQLKKIKSRSQIWNLRNLARNIARALNKNN